MPTTLPKYLSKFPNDWRLTDKGKPLSPISEARTLQRLIFSTAQKKETTPVALAALARAWSCLQTSIREMRGIPLPGHLQPSMDAVLNAKRGKRGRVIELVEEPREAPETPTPAADTDARPTTAQTPAAEHSKKVCSNDEIVVDTKPANPPQ